LKKGDFNNELQKELLVAAGFSLRLHRRDARATSCRIEAFDLAGLSPPLKKGDLGGFQGII
jgi:hypothetical protein